MKYIEIKIEEIHRDEKQPRLDFSSVMNPDDDLVVSIREHGVLQPILVRQAGDHRYIIIAGERRWRASRMAGRDTIPALVADDKQLRNGAKLDEASVLVLALTENIQRENLSEFETAQALGRLRDEFGFTQSDLAKRIGKSPTVVSKLLQLTKPENQDDIRVCRTSKDGKGIANTLAEFQQLPRPVQMTLRRIHDKTGGTFTENDFDKIRAFLKAGNELLETNVDNVMSATLSQLEDRARDFEIAKRSAVPRPVEPSGGAEPTGGVPAQALYREQSAPDALFVDTGKGQIHDSGSGFDFSGFLARAQAAVSGAPMPAAQPAVDFEADFEGFCNPPPQPAEIPPLDLSGVVLSGQQIKALLKALGADSEVNSLLAHRLLLESLRKLR